MAHSSLFLDNELETALLKEARAIYKLGYWVAPLLYFSFWLVDLVYSYQQKWLFFGLRSIFVLCSFLMMLYFKKERSIRAYQVAGIIWSFIGANLITAMIFLTAGPTSIYFAGLNLVALLAVFFIPFEPIIMAVCIAGIYLPFYILTFLGGASSYYHDLLISTSFAVGTVLIAITNRITYSRSRKREIEAKLALADEIRDRERTIQSKTIESVKLAQLSNQFSPQVVEAIRTNTLQLSAGTRRSQICAIFIDIVNSTERVIRVDKDKIHKALSMFLEDSVRILLKYDITIDKFLGDGILAFCNDPVRHNDYIERTVNAALEIKNKVCQRQEEYENYWMNEFQIRIGISSGFANVGFYGNEKLYKCYTAIGPVVNLSSRLCSVAEPNQIVLSHDVYEALRHEQFELNFIGKKVLKGFEQDIIKVYSVDGHSSVKISNSADSIDCPKCKMGILFLDNNESGHMVFKCRSCNYIHESMVNINNSKRVS